MKHQHLIENDKLAADSEVYKIKSKTYELFSKAEDKPNKISNFLVPFIKNKIVLDFGCGTGKFIPKLAPLTNLYYAMDNSKNQLEIAKEKANNYNNVKFIQNPSDKIPLESSSVDVILVIWVIGSIHNLELRKKIIDEFKRVIKKSGSIYIIENDTGGEYKELVEGSLGNDKTNFKLDWLKKNGFKKVDSLKTYFEFESLESAKKIFEVIWDKEIASKINKTKISHNVTIYKNGK